MTKLTLEYLIDNIKFYNESRISDVLMLFGWCKSRKECIRNIKSDGVKWCDRKIKFDYYIGMIDDRACLWYVENNILHLRIGEDEITIDNCHLVQ